MTIEPTFMPRTPGNIADADQVKAGAIDALRESEFAIVLVQAKDGTRRILTVADGAAGEIAEFIVASQGQLTQFAVEAVSKLLTEVVSACPCGRNEAAGCPDCQEPS